VADVDLGVFRDALAGDRRAIRAFVSAMSPIIEARIARALARRKEQRAGRDLRQEVEDMTQDVFASLFAHDGRVLRTWDARKGLSLANFVGLVTERQVASILRSGRRNPWRDHPEELDEIERAADVVPDVLPQLESREELAALLDRLRASLSPRGLVLFERLYVGEEPVDVVAADLGMTRDAVYMWRSRVNKLLATFVLDPDPSPRTPEEGKK
jgi:RNA polymerase sigma-70 factor (ECF subfamily)